MIKNSDKKQSAILSRLELGNGAICAKYGNEALANETKIIKKKRVGNNSLKYYTTADEK